MDKQQLLEFINKLPDDVFAQPFEASESVQECLELIPLTPFFGQYGGRYERPVHNEITLRLKFTTAYAGEFRRTYTEPDGRWHNMRRVR